MGRIRYPGRRITADGELEGSAMERSVSFADVLEAVGQLSDEDQEALVEIVRRRASELGRKRVAAQAQEARREFAEGHCRSTSPAELMGEILS